MVKHTLTWALIVVTSLGAVYSMSHASTEAESTIHDSSENSIVSIPIPPAKPQRTESGLDYFRFQNGYLEWKIQHIYSKYEIEKEKFNIRCYGRTYFLDSQRKEFVEEMNDYFSGKLAMTPEDDEGYASGSVRIVLRPETMRYNLICGWFEKLIEVTPRDWPSNIYLKEFESLKTRSAQLSARSEKNAKKSAYTTVQNATQELVSVAAAGGKKASKLIPGSKNAVVAAFVLDAKKKMRIKSITLSYGKQKGVLKHLRITLDGKDPDSWDVSGGKNTLHWAGLGSYGLFESVTPGKHLIEIKASIINPPNKMLFTDAYKVEAIGGVAGNGLKVKLKTPIQLQTFSVPFDKNRTKKQDDELGL